MATLSIRSLPDEDHKALRLRAARHGVSMEAEARAILHRALQEESPTEQEFAARVQEVQAWVARLPMRAALGGVDDFIAERRREAAAEEAARDRPQRP